MAKNKRPLSINNPKTEKIPRHLDPYIDQNKVFWSFSIYDSLINFPGIGTRDFSFSVIANYFCDCEKRTWADIERNHKRDHSIEISKLAKFARERLVEIQQDDIDHLWSIHVNGLFRIWGIRDHSLLKVIWLDPNHKICPSNKRNT